jgi:hypothetical protein
MTIERRMMMGLDDIRAVSFQCDHCKFRITMFPDDIKEIPKNCPSNHRWISGEPEATVIPPLLKFSDGLAKLRTFIGKKALGFSILLEFDEPKAS